MNSPEEAPVIHGFLVRKGSLVRINEGIKGFPLGKGSPFGRVVRLMRKNAVVNVDGVEHVVPLKEMTMCRRDGDRLDSKGRLLDAGMKVRIVCKGGHISGNDLGCEGVILSMGRVNAKVQYRKFGYDEVKYIPFDYLWRPDYAN